MTDKNLESLFLEHLQDIYFAENQILKALPKMAEGAELPKLAAAFKKHLEETKGQVDRLEQVFEILGKPAKGKTCPAIKGILEEGEATLKEYKGSAALDAGLVASAQAVEHYEITRYGTLKRWAEVLGMKEAARLLDETLKQECKADEDLTKLADAQSNAKALRAAA